MHMKNWPLMDEAGGTPAPGGSGTPAGGTPAGGTPAGGTPAAWHDSFDAETKGWVANRGLDKLEPNVALAEVIKTARNAEKHIGVPADQLLRLPTDKSSSDEVNQFYTRLGKPAAPAEYKLPVPEGADPAFANEAANWFHANNVPVKMAQGIVAKYNEYVTAQVKAANDKGAADLDADVKSLRTEWGQGYDNEILKARTAAREFGMDDATIDQLQAGLGFSKMMKFLSKIGAKVGESQFHSGDNRAQSNGKMTPEQARQAIAEKKADKEWFAKLSAGNAEAKAEWNRLNEMAGFGA